MDKNVDNSQSIELKVLSDFNYTVKDIVKDVVKCACSLNVLALCGIHQHQIVYIAIDAIDSYKKGVLIASILPKLSYA